jgi:hypothetical protein
MRPDTRSWLACVLVVCSACSAIVDFPDKAPSRTPDGSIDGGLMDAAMAMIDARRPGSGDDARVDTGTAVDCTRNTDCSSSELCCPVMGSNECVATNVERCTSCNQGCNSPAAPNCGARVCECVAGTGKGCEAGQLCVGQGAAAKCVECTTNAECAQKGGATQCVDSKCVQCSRGAMLDSSDDDVGCSGATPICGETNTCVGCNDAAPATQCPGDGMCTPGLPCGGCKLNTPIGLSSNGCPDGNPICKTINGAQQCAGCVNNLDCKFVEGQGYCHELTGLCSNKCDPDGATGANGCVTPGAPYCKPAAGVPGGYDCAACTAGDCTVGKFCATAGNHAGSCVQCRDSSDCNPNGLSPVCDASTNTCRARTMADCAAPTPYLDGTFTCVECINDDPCRPMGKVCNLALRRCAQCSDDMQCSPAKPTCDQTTGTCKTGCSALTCTALYPVLAPQCSDDLTSCVQCKASSNCNGDPTKPICSVAGTCVACDLLMPIPNAGDAACDSRERGTQCITSKGPNGRCGACDPARPATCPGATTCVLNPTTMLPACQ